MEQLGRTLGLERDDEWSQNRELGSERDDDWSQNREMGSDRDDGRSNLMGRHNIWSRSWQET